MSQPTGKREANKQEKLRTFYFQSIFSRILSTPQRRRVPVMHEIYDNMPIIYKSEFSSRVDFIAKMNQMLDEHDKAGKPSESKTIPGLIPGF